MNLNDYTLVWEDDFNIDGPVDSSKWSFETGNHQWPNKELQAYTDRPTNVHVKDGNLVITALKEQDGERSYTSAKITTAGKKSFQYGYFEFRAKIPRGKGSWPAIWMMPEHDWSFLPDYVPRKENGRPDWPKITEEMKQQFGGIPDKMKWPECGEIDIVEHVGRMENDLLFSLHNKNHNHANKKTVPYTKRVHFDIDLWDDFHNYAMEWTKDYIEYFIDGVSYCRYNRSDDKECQGHDSWPYDKPYFIIMNIAVGGGLGGPVDETALPYNFLIDYVRVWQKIDA